MYSQLIACLCRSEIIMNNKGNQKHLTFEQRIDIEKGLTENKSFAEIGRIIGKDPSTISKEMRLHAHTKERPDAGYTNPPCIHRKTCKIVCLCDEQCGILCKLCRWNCQEKCSRINSLISICSYAARSVSSCNNLYTAGG